MVFFNKIIDQSGRGLQGGTDNNASFRSDDKCDGPAAGAEDLVDVDFIHGRIRIYCTVSLGNEKRYRMLHHRVFSAQNGFSRR